ncbi:hypothetical protein ACOMHN_032835 [Nucella lapillus]
MYILLEYKRRGSEKRKVGTPEYNRPIKQVDKALAEGKTSLALVHLSDIKYIPGEVCPSHATLEPIKEKAKSHNSQFQLINQTFFHLTFLFLPALKANIRPGPKKPAVITWFDTTNVAMDGHTAVSPMLMTQ